MSFTYFAYGSNLLPARLQARCPSARVIGTGLAHRYALDYSKPGRDGTGKATLFASDRAATPGVLYLIDDDDRQHLDRAEGPGYDRVDDFAVATDSDGMVEATTYLARHRDTALLPFDWYLALVLCGARFHGLAADHLTCLEHVEDTDLSRPGRTAALDALSVHGYTEVLKNLRS